MWARSGKPRFPKYFFHKVLPMFKHLQDLDVSLNNREFDDSSMKILGVHCQYLK